ncbi:unnamed protein product [Peniophora sp. CBMAI 1063]|nr:unnamed protein product [Peniophora sp. CBMAI 1063]
MWFSDYLEACSEELYARPLADVVISPSFYLRFLKEAIACPHCSDHIDTFLTWFHPHLKKRIDEELDQIKLNIVS